MHKQEYWHEYGYDITTQSNFWKIITWNDRYDTSMTRVQHEYDMIVATRIATQQQPKKKKEKKRKKEAS